MLLLHPRRHCDPNLDLLAGPLVEQEQESPIKYHSMTPAQQLVVHPVFSPSLASYVRDC
jgi:hypothetical protein